MGEFIKKWSQKPHKIRLRDSESVLFGKRRGIGMETIVTIAFVAVVGIAIASAIIKIVRNKKQ